MYYTFIRLLLTNPTIRVRLASRNTVLLPATELLVEGESVVSEDFLLNLFSVEKVLLSITLPLISLAALVLNKLLTVTCIVSIGLDLLTMCTKAFPGSPGLAFAQLVPSAFPAPIGVT